MFNHLKSEVKRIKKEAEEQVKEHFQVSDLILEDKKGLRKEVTNTIQSLFTQENIGYMHVETEYYKVEIRNPSMDNRGGPIFVSVIDKMQFIDKEERSKELNQREKELSLLNDTEIEQIASAFGNTTAQIRAGFHDIHFGYPKTGIAVRWL